MPVRSTKNVKGPAGAAAVESEKGVPLAPSAKDLNPWYSDKDRERTFKETDDDRRYVSIFHHTLSLPLPPFHPSPSPTSVRVSGC